MKIRLFGDSWIWAWPFPLDDSMKSKRMMKVTAGEGQRAVSLMEWYLNKVDIETEIVAYPGRTLRMVTDTIVESTDNADYNVVFVPSPFRVEQVPKLNVANYDNFMEQWNTEIVTNLNRIQEWAKQNNQIVLLVGGQTTLYEHLFNSINSTENMHLLSECLISDLIQQEPKFGIFKLADFTKYIDDKFDNALVNHIYNDMITYSPNVHRDNVTWPDVAHLNPTGMFLFVDLLLSKIEELEGERT